MKRRTFMITTAAGLAGLSGCIDGGGNGNGNGGNNTTGNNSDNDGQNNTGTPELTDTEFEVQDIQSGTEVNEAQVEFDQENSSVGITGTISGSDGCKTAALSNAEYNQEEDELRVEIITRDREDAGDTCTQAIVEINYTATIHFSGSLPHNASVYHNGNMVSGASWMADSASAEAPDS